MKYKNAVNNRGNEKVNYKDTDIKFLLKFKQDDVLLIEVEKVEFVTNHAPKLIINDEYKILLWVQNPYPHYDPTYFLRQTDESLAVYDDEKSMMKDLVNWYQARLVLLTKYKDNVKSTEARLRNIEKQIKGREEYLI